MPLPMVHLSIAHSLAEAIDPRGDRDLYYVGAIAPDGIHKRANATREDKRRIHLAGSRTQSLTDRLETIDAFVGTWRTRIEPGYLLGWATHLVADSIWSRHVVRGVWADATADIAQPQRDRLYYAEADQADFNLFRRESWREKVWDRLAAAEITDFADLLTSDEIGAWRDRTLKWFTETKQEPMVDLSVITMSLIDQYIDTTVTILLDGVDRGFAAATVGISGVHGNGLFRDSQAGSVAS